VSSNPLLMRGSYGPGVQSAGYRRAPKQEKKVAADMDGYRISGSGSGRQKGDARKVGIARIECKNTSFESFRITVDMLEKIENAAYPNDEIPAIHIEFIDGFGRVKREAVVISYDDLKDLLHELAEAREKE